MSGIWGLRLGVLGLGFRVCRLGFRVSGLGFRVEGFKGLLLAILCAPDAMSVSKERDSLTSYGVSIRVVL